MELREAVTGSLKDCISQFSPFSGSIIASQPPTTVLPFSYLATVGGMSVSLSSAAVPPKLSKGLCGFPDGFWFITRFYGAVSGKRSVWEEKGAKGPYGRGKGEQKPPNSWGLRHRRKNKRTDPQQANTVFLLARSQTLSSKAFKALIIYVKVSNPPVNLQ